MTVRSTLLVAGLLAALAAPAAAATYTATYSGKIGFGFDTTGFFGTAGSLNEVDYVMVYAIDDAAPGAMFPTTATGSGIAGLGAASPVRMAITINGVTRRIDGSTSGAAHVNDGVQASNLAFAGVFDRVDATAIEQRITPDFYHEYTADTYIASYAQDFVGSADFRMPVGYGGTTGSDSIYNLVQFNDFDFTTNSQINYAYLNMRIGDYRFAAVTPGGGASGVPEPAGWALLVIGFGFVGASLRRRAVRSVSC